MRIDPVDPRDISWENDRPVYRVYFWTPGRSACEEYRVQDASSVREVLAWARDQTAPSGSQAGRSAELWIEAETRDGLGLLRLEDATQT